MPRILRSMLLLCLPLLCLQQVSASPDRMQFYYHIAEGNYLIGDFSGAERVIDEMLRIEEDYAPAHALKARVLLDTERAPEALAAAESASASVPENLEYQLLQALVLGNLDRRTEALELIDAVLTEAPPASDDAAVAKQLKGLMKMAERDWDEAADLFKSIYNSDSAKATTGRQLASEAYLEKAQSQLDKGQRIEAIDSIDEAIALYQDAGSSDALKHRDNLRLLRARTLARIGAPEEAISDLRQLVAQSPSNLEAVTTLASLYASTEQWESLGGLIEPIATRPELVDVALFLEGRVALASDRVGTARKKFEEAIELQNRQPTGLLPALLFYRGVSLEKLGRGDEAQSAIKEAEEKGFRPETIDEAAILAGMLLRTKQSEKAIPILESALLAASRSRDSAKAWALLGRAHKSQDNTTLAISALNESLTLDPNQAIARALRGSLLRKIGDLEGAVADYEAASILDPSNSAVLYALALTYLQLGQLHEAEQTLGLSVQLNAYQPGQILLHAILAYVTGASQTASQSLKSYFDVATTQTNPSAHYLHYLLHGEPREFNDPVLEYFAASARRKEVIDWAGRAEDPRTAQRQICSAAFWLAQHEQDSGDSQSAAELLDIALKMGSSENPEWQFAQWQRRNAAADKDSN